LTAVTGPYDEIPPQVLFSPEPLLEKDVILVTDDMLQKRGFGKFDRLDFQVIPADEFQVFVDAPDSQVHALGPVPFHQGSLVLEQVVLVQRTVMCIIVLYRIPVGND
jgi:hypothetical protein